MQVKWQSTFYWIWKDTLLRKFHEDDVSVISCLVWLSHLLISSRCKHFAMNYSSLTLEISLKFACPLVCPKNTQDSVWPHMHGYWMPYIGLGKEAFPNSLFHITNSLKFLILWSLKMKEQLFELLNRDSEIYQQSIKEFPEGDCNFHATAGC